MVRSWRLYEVAPSFHIGLDTATHRDSFETVAGFPDQLKIIERHKKRGKATAYDGMVVDKHDSDMI